MLIMCPFVLSTLHFFPFLRICGCVLFFSFLLSVICVVHFLIWLHLIVFLMIFDLPIFFFFYLYSVYTFIYIICCCVYFSHVFYFLFCFVALFGISSSSYPFICWHCVHFFFVCMCFSFTILYYLWWNSFWRNKHTRGHTHTRTHFLYTDT